jgi:AcrR family transcriptional regulator
MAQNSNDLRVRRTRKLLREALIALIEEQSFDAITVGAIAERAMVSRAAFYRYYQDKYDLVEKIFEEAMQTLIREMDHYSGDVAIEHPPESWVTRLDQGVEAERTPEPFVRLFEHFAAYERLYRALLGGKGSPWFLTRMRAYLADVLCERTQELTFQPNGKRIAESSVFAEGFVPALLAGLLIDAITWWLEHGRHYPPRQMATYCHRLVLSSLREVSKWE